MQLLILALLRLFSKTGNSNEARIPMIAITTRSSTKVKIDFLSAIFSPFTYSADFH